MAKVSEEMEIRAVDWMIVSFILTYVLSQQSFHVIYLSEYPSKDGCKKHISQKLSINISYELKDIQIPIKLYNIYTATTCA